MRASFSHIALYVSSQRRSTSFYLTALEPLGFALADEVQDRYARISNDADMTIVLSQVSADYERFGYHRKRIGLHHFALRVERRETVDAMTDHLARLGVPLVGLGRVENDYRGGYDALMFEDPDRILVEIAWHGHSYFAVAAESG